MNNMNCFGREKRHSGSRSGSSVHRHLWRRSGIVSNPEVVRRTNPPVEVRPRPVTPISISDPGFNAGQSSQTDFSYLHNKGSHDLREFTHAELKAATKNFSQHNLIGEGGFGQVYKGVIRQKSKLHNGEDQKVEVAVKQLNRNGVQGHNEWRTEVRFLGVVDNPYLVKLIGYCADDDERGMQRLLVYEYMPNRGLDDHIFRTHPPILSWQTRVSIALGAARGLAYLHEEMDVHVIFRDFKTSNVLLDEEFNPKLSDFGLARQGPDMGKSHVSTGVKGTYGYAAPEYIQTGHLTFKSDVWSFGVVMLEMLTGRRVMDRNRPKSEQKLLEWVKPHITDQRKLHNVVDPQLEGRYPMKAAVQFANIATNCLVKQPKGRPKMSEVVEGLQKVLEMTFTWENPGISLHATDNINIAGAVTKRGSSSTSGVSAPDVDSSSASGIRTMVLPRRQPMRTPTRTPELRNPQQPLPLPSPETVRQFQKVPSAPPNTSYNLEPEPETSQEEQRPSSPVHNPAHDNIQQSSRKPDNSSARLSWRPNVLISSPS